MKISVFSGLRSRPVCLIAGRLTEKESFPGQDERARAATAFETGVGCPEIKDPKSKKVEKDLHRHLAWMPDCLRSGPKIPRQPRSPADDGLFSNR